MEIKKRLSRKMGYKSLLNAMREVKRHERAYLDLESKTYLPTFKRLNSIKWCEWKHYWQLKSELGVSNWRPNDLVKKIGHTIKDPEQQRQS